MYAIDRTLVAKTTPDKVYYSSKNTLLAKSVSESGFRSKEEIKNLKRRTMLDDKPEGTIQRLHSLWTRFISALTPRIKKRRRNGNCRVDGHVLPYRLWRAGELPTCAECGRVIEDPNSLRRAL
jgi:hypothetical protein